MCCGRWALIAVNSKLEWVGTGVPGYVLYKGAGQVSSVRTSWAGRGSFFSFLTTPLNRGNFQLCQVNVLLGLLGKVSKPGLSLDGFIILLARCEMCKTVRGEGTEPFATVRRETIPTITSTGYYDFKEMLANLVVEMVF